MYRIMTVCTGNICRSPVGEYLIREHARQAGLEVEVASSAITDYEIGNPIDTRAGRILTARGIDPSGHRASRFVVEDFDRYDLILAMDTPHYLHLKQLARTEDDKAKIRMMRSFDPAMAGKNLDELGIYDPWYGQMRDFEYTTELIDTAARALIAGLAAEGELLTDQLGAVTSLHEVEGRGAVGTPGTEGEGVDLGGMGQWARYEVDLTAAQRREGARPVVLQHDLHTEAAAGRELLRQLVDGPRTQAVLDLDGAVGIGREDAQHALALDLGPVALDYSLLAGLASARAGTQVVHQSEGQQQRKEVAEEAWGELGERHRRG